MHKVERIVVYGLLAASFAWSTARMRAADADGAADGRFNIVTCAELKVIDSEGRVVARLASNAKGGIFTWTATSSAASGELAVNDFGAFLSTMNKDGKASSYVGTGSDSAVGLVTTCDSKGDRRAAIIGNEAGGYATFLNAKGELVALIGTANDTKAGLLSLSSEKGVRHAMLTGANEGGWLATWNSDGKQTTLAGTKVDTGAGIFAVFKKDGVHARSLLP